MLAKSEHPSAWPNVLNIKVYYSKNWPRASCWPSADKFFELQVLMLSKAEPLAMLNAKQTEQTPPRPL